MLWHDLLFMHWPVPAGALRPLIPPSLTLETYDGAAWLGVVPFRMSGVRPRLVPPLPWLSAFPELNVRTYVTAGGKPGVWFFSLDAANPVAVEAARLGFHLPYYTARMVCEPEGEGIRYESERTHRGAPPAALRMRYRPTGRAYRSTPGTLEHWLTARYCLYAADRRGHTWRCEIDHPPWPLQPAEAAIEHNTMAEPIGLQLAAPPALLHFARYQEVVAWLLERVPG
ncbi:MAG TPA: DUF2071 domain-containing protein [Roseiflexaceae bacterium]|nr:DUF2071 domain-containing protein [Roseiflexaceae bacterium]